MTLPKRGAGRRRRLRQWPLGSCLAAVVVGLVLVGQNHLKRGCGLIGVALLVAAALRLVLRDRDAGLLVVRSRWADVAVTTALGVALIVVTVVVPPGR
jgi:hypothetical protein